METLTPLSYSHVVKILRDFLHQPPNHKHINKTSWLKLKKLLKKKAPCTIIKKSKMGRVQILVSLHKVYVMVFNVTIHQ